MQTKGERGKIESNNCRWWCKKSSIVHWDTIHVVTRHHLFIARAHSGFLSLFSCQFSKNNNNKIWRHDWIWRICHQAFAVFYFFFAVATKTKISLAKCCCSTLAGQALDSLLSCCRWYSLQMACHYADCLVLIGRNRRRFDCLRRSITLARLDGNAQIFFIFTASRWWRKVTQFTECSFRRRIWWHLTIYATASASALFAVIQRHSRHFCVVCMIPQNIVNHGSFAQIWRGRGMKT